MVARTRVFGSYLYLVYRPQVCRWMRGYCESYIGIKDNGNIFNLSTWKDEVDLDCEGADSARIMLTGEKNKILGCT